MGTPLSRFSRRPSSARTSSDSDDFIVNVDARRQSLLSSSGSEAGEATSNGDRSLGNGEVKRRDQSFRERRRSRERSRPSSVCLDDVLAANIGEDPASTSTPKEAVKVSTHTSKMHNGTSSPIELDKHFRRVSSDSISFKARTDLIGSPPEEARRSNQVFADMKMADQRTSQTEEETVAVRKVSTTSNSSTISGSQALTLFHRVKRNPTSEALSPPPLESASDDTSELYFTPPSVNQSHKNLATSAESSQEEKTEEERESPVKPVQQKSEIKNESSGGADVIEEVVENGAQEEEETLVVEPRRQSVAPGKMLDQRMKRMMALQMEGTLVDSQPDKIETGRVREKEMHSRSLHAPSLATPVSLPQYNLTVCTHTYVCTYI